MLDIQYFRKKMQKYVILLFTPTKFKVYQFNLYIVINPLRERLVAYGRSKAFVLIL